MPTGTIVMFVIGLEWLFAAWGKFYRPNFMQSIQKTLELFAERTNFSFYEKFLRVHAIPNARRLGQIVRLSQLLAAVTLLIGTAILLTTSHFHHVVYSLAILALVGGAIMNLHFYLASSWSGPAAAGVNRVMGLAQLVTALFFVTQLI